MTYNYLENMIEDVKESFEENKVSQGWDKLIEKNDIQTLHEEMYDFMFCDDSVTGNASGSYTCNSWVAENNLCHNLELLGEACDEFDCKPKLDNAEWCDVTIRCYLLDNAISEVIKSL